MAQLKWFGTLQAFKHLGIWQLSGVLFYDNKMEHPFKKWGKVMVLFCKFGWMVALLFWLGQKEKLGAWLVSYLSHKHWNFMGFGFVKDVDPISVDQEWNASAVAIVSDLQWYLYKGNLDSIC